MFTARQLLEQLNQLNSLDNSAHELVEQAKIFNQNLGIVRILWERSNWASQPLDVVRFQGQWDLLTQYIDMQSNWIKTGARAEVVQLNTIVRGWIISGSSDPSLSAQLIFTKMCRMELLSLSFDDISNYILNPHDNVFGKICSQSIELLNRLGGFNGMHIPDNHPIWSHIPGAGVNDVSSDSVRETFKLVVKQVYEYKIENSQVLSYLKNNGLLYVFRTS